MMVEQRQQQNAALSEQAQGPGVFPLDPVSTLSLWERTKYTAGTALTIGGLAELVGFGSLGLLLGAAGGVAGCVFSDELHQFMLDHLPAPKGARGSRKSRMHWWLTGEALPQTGEAEGDDLEESEEESLATPEEPMPPTERVPETPASHGTIPAQFELRAGGRTLAAMKELNQKRFVYFGQAMNGPVVLNIDDMYHVLDVAKSGRGKSNRFRNGMMQLVNLADTYYLNPFAAPVKSVTDARKIEVWQPIYDRLANGHPVRESAEIAQVLADLVQEIDTRSELEQRRDFSWREHPIFAFIDEVPEIFARCPEAIKLLDRIGRTGRQFGVFAWIASQTALVSDIGLSTASQAQFKTLIYGGGDKTSGNRVIGSVSQAQEKALKTNGAGLTLMIADGLDDTKYVRAPLVTNEALFSYFSLPPFNIKEWLTPRSKTQQAADLLDVSFSSESHTPATFHARDERVKEPEYERFQEVKEPGERDERHESFHERDESFTISHEDEIAVLMAALDLQKEGANVTREAIKQRLGWTNAKHPVVKIVCDRHKIAVR